MNVTFFIGNGFDLGVGLKSSFRDFFPIYKLISKIKPDHIRRLSTEIDNDYNTWSDFENALGQYTIKFSTENKSELIDQKTDFEREFVSYLKNQESIVFDDNWINTLKNEISYIFIKGLFSYHSRDNLDKESTDILSKIYKKHKSEKIHFNFLNFNYTNVLKRILDIVRECDKDANYKNHHIFSLDSVVHVHGQYDLHPIIGLNDVSQISNKELSKDSRLMSYLLKPQINKRLRNGNEQDSVDIIDKSNIICIYGMSIGDTDKKWWNLLMQWLHKDNDRQLIIFDYDMNYKTDTPYEKIEKEYYYIDKFNSALEDKTIDVNNMHSRIHIAVNKNIFSINHLTDPIIKQYDESFDKAFKELMS